MGFKLLRSLSIGSMRNVIIICSVDKTINGIKELLSGISKVQLNFLLSISSSIGKSKNK